MHSPRAYGITGTIYYGYRAWGPNWTYSASWTPGSAVGFVSDVDAAGQPLQPEQAAVRPVRARAEPRPEQPDNTDGTWSTPAAPCTALKDSGPWAPKGIVLAPDTTSYGTKPTRALKDDIVYEVHVRGLTKNDTSIPPRIAARTRGRAEGAGAGRLGVTAVEFLPVQETQNDTNDVDPTRTTEATTTGAT
jgi:isoamylase